MSDLTARMQANGVSDNHEQALVINNVTYQGAISVNNCIIYQKTDNVMAFCIDTKNKWGEILSTGSNENDIPCIALEANENTTNIRKGKTTNDLTEIEFPEYAGWTIFCCSWSKYSVYVCMVKRGNMFAGLP